MMDTEELPEDSPSRLRDTARSSLLWGGGFTIFSDVAQFAVMLVLVRLLTPADYAVAALAQAMIGVAAVVSFQPFSYHALQARDPRTIDWQTMMTSALVMNTALSVLLLLVAAGLWFTDDYRVTAVPLAAMSSIFLVDMLGQVRQRMLEANHQWQRYRILQAIGTAGGLLAGLAIALAGGGVWALIVQPVLTALPAAVDLLFVQKFRPDFSWHREEARRLFKFGFDRLGSGLAQRGRVLNENVMVSSVFSLTSLGMFNRANGLAMLLVGRLGPIILTALFAVLTRAERGSDRFRRLAGLTMRGVVWLTLPAGAVLTLMAQDVVLLLYGPQWTGVVAILPLAAALTGTLSVLNMLTLLLVANEDSRLALYIDIVTGVGAILLAFLLIPQGVTEYLGGLCVMGVALILTAGAVLLRHHVTTGRDMVAAFVPPLIAALVAGFAVVLVDGAVDWDGWLRVLPLFAKGAIFALVFGAVLRFGFARLLRELLDVAPGGELGARVLGYHRRATA